MKSNTNFLRVIQTLIVVSMALGGACGKAPSTIVVSEPVSLRWMDRNIYLALPNGTDKNRNNVFQKQKLRETLDEIESNTMLGQGYFNYTEVDEALLQPVSDPTTSGDSFKSFILIWPDNVFNQYVLDKMGGSIPDPYALTVINSANKRQFFMILKASCFSTSSSCNNIGTAGLRAMVARQLGLLTGLKLKDCSTSPTDAMCADSPSDVQWSNSSKQVWSNSFSNILETIIRNPHFYDVTPPPASSP